MAPNINNAWYCTLPTEASPSSVAMVAGMVPIAAGLTADPSFRAPMALAVIGGLVTSTLLSLVVVPALYVVIEGLGQRLTRLRWGGRVAAGA